MKILKSLPLAAFVLVSSLTFAQKKFPKDNVWYKIQNMEGQRFLTSNNSKTNGSNVKAKTSTGTAGYWKFYHKEDGYVVIRNRVSGFYLSCHTSTDEHSHIKQIKGISEGAYWKVKGNNRGLYYLINKLSGMWLSLEGVHENSNITQLAASGRLTQWKLVEKGPITH